MSRFSFWSLLLAALIFGQFSAFSADDNLKLSSKEREKAEERAEAIRQEYLVQARMKLALQHEKRYRLYTISSLEVKAIPAGTLLEALRDNAKKNDPEGGGFNMLFTCDKAKLQTPITMDLQEIPLTDVLRYIGLSADLDFRYEEHAIVVVNAGQRDGDLAVAPTAAATE